MLMIYGPNFQHLSSEMSENILKSVGKSIKNFVNFCAFIESFCYLKEQKM